jgi:hypothetical protein
MSYEYSGNSQRFFCDFGERQSHAAGSTAGLPLLNSLNDVSLNAIGKKSEASGE